MMYECICSTCGKHFMNENKRACWCGCVVETPMSNDMPDVGYVSREYLVDEDCPYKGSVRYFDEDDVYGDSSKYYLESNVQQLIKEAEERQRERCANALNGYEPCIAKSLFPELYRAILNAGGE